MENGEQNGDAHQNGKWKMKYWSERQRGREKEKGRANNL